MSKICPQCGVKYKNDAQKCIMCGTEFDDVPIHRARKRLVILGIVTAVLFAACAAFLIASAGPKAAARHIMAAYKRNDAEEIVTSYPDFLMLSDYIDAQAMLRDTEYTAEILSEYILSYSLGEPKTPSDKEYKELMQVFRFYGGDRFDEGKIEDIKIILVNYKGNLPIFWTSHAIQFTMVKYNGRWCLWPDFVWEISDYS